MIGPVTLHDLTGNRGLIEFGKIEADRIGLEFVREFLRRQRRDQGGINSPAEETRDGNIGEEMFFDRVIDQAAQPPGHVVRE